MFPLIRIQIIFMFFFSLSSWVEWHRAVVVKFDFLFCIGPLFNVIWVVHSILFQCQLYSIVLSRSESLF